MAWAAANLKAVRQEVIKRLYTDEDTIVSTASGGSTTSIVDAGAAWATSDLGQTLGSGVLSNRNFIGAYVYLGGVAAPSWSRVTAYDPSTATLTLSPALGATANGQEYEIHYKLHPERINQFIKDRARVGSRQAMDTIAEGTAINFDFNVMAEGVLADCKRVLAKRLAPGDPERQALMDEAIMHEQMWQEGLIMAGYGPSWMAPSPDIGKSETADVIDGSALTGTSPGIGR